MNDEQKVRRAFAGAPAPTRDPVAQFEETTIWHPKLAHAMTQVLALVGRRRGPRIILLVGPAGAGKSHLLGGIVNVLNFRAHPLMEADPGRRAAAMVEADAPMSDVFSWPPLLRAVMEELGEPSVGRQVVTRGPGRPEPIWGGRQQPNELFAATVGACRRRQLNVLGIDEAHHIAWVASPRRFVEQLERIKSFTNRSGVTMILCGSYELLRFSELSGQLLRRSDVVHLSRYRSERPEELDTFKSVVADLAASLPLPCRVDLADRWQDAYERCGGLIGILHGWMANALAAAAAEHAPAITAGHLREAAMPPERLLRIVEEARKGENIDANEDHARRALRRDLGLWVPSSGRARAAAKAEPATPAAGPAAGSEPRHPSAARRPGERRPRRDPVGVAREEVSA
jgi:AAA domain